MMRDVFEFYLASNNPHKAVEIEEALALAGCAARVRPASEVGGMPEVDETEDTLLGNAQLKARALSAKAPGSWVLADDTGLMVDALGGRPGVRTARYAGPGASHADNNAKLMNALHGLSAEKRSARFECCFFLTNGQTEHVFTGVMEGRIAEVSAGGGGFGYDPIFIPAKYECTVAELPADTKNRISHRARAVQQLAQWISHRD